MNRRNDSGSADGSTNTIRTVASGKNYHIFNCRLSCINIGSSLGVARLGIYNASDTHQYTLLYSKCMPEQKDQVTLGMYFPVIVPEGYKVKLISEDADMQAWCFVSGYEA